MPEVVAVKLRYSPKNLWFEVGEVRPALDDHVVVETERGLEMGSCCSEPFDVTEDDLKAPLKPVVRIADEADIDTDELHREREEVMFSTFKELAEKYDLNMKPVTVEYLFGGDKAVFYFVAEERVDFRELVRDLASRLRIRVDMRQIGVRDEARMIGGLGHCGQELCCARFGGEFQPVSIRMAKEQDLPLNPLKISGLCGRLMCCLRHEFDAYKDFKGRAPKRGTIVDTPLGAAKVISFDTPNEVITMQLEDGKQLSIPLGKIDCERDESGKCTCPCSVSQETLEETEGAQLDLALSVFDTSTDPGVVKILEEEAAEEKAAKKGKGQRRRGGGRGPKSRGGGDKQRSEKSRGGDKPKDGQANKKSPQHKARGGRGRQSSPSEGDAVASTGGRRRRRRSSASSGASSPSDK